MADELETAADALLDAGWERGWLAIRQTLRHDGKGMPAAIKTRLESLEERIKPQTLVGRVKAIVLSGSTAGVYFLDGETTVAGFERVDQTARELGELVAGDADAFAAVLPLVVRKEQGRQGAFGEGLAAGVDSIDDCWAALVSAFEATLEEERNVQVLRGFMYGAFRRDSAKFEAFLDAAMERASFINLVPFLQLAAPLGDSGCTRLMASLDNPSVPSWAFRYLGHSRATQALSDDWVAQLLQRLSVKPDGMEVAVDVLSMHIFDNPNPVGPRVRQLGRALLTNVPLTQHDHGLDHALERLVEFFLQGREGEAAARELLTTVRRGFEDYSLSGYGLAGTLAALFKVQPNAALETLVGDGLDEGNTYFRRRSLMGVQGVSALSEVPIEMLVAWCEKGGPERWSHVAPLLVAFDSQTEQSGLHWPASVLALLKRAPQPIEVARSLVELIEPMSYSGSRAEAIRQRLPLLDALARELGAMHAEQIELWRSQIIRIMDREARRELEEHRARDERFE
ncbi:MAG: hypothetical protein EON56_02590 [Alphaproteobacteria bacterium]|nr:MAG: hypothetical protein EON56_02590 [Alphaproteobacteria bacterium]